MGGDPETGLRPKAGVSGSKYQGPTVPEALFPSGDYRDKIVKITMEAQTHFTGAKRVS